MSNLLSFDVGHLAGSGEGFLEAAQIDAIAEEGKFAEKFEVFRQKLGGGKYSLTAPFDSDEGVKATKAVAEAAKGKYENVLLIGIGGSTLGARAILQALRGPFHNLFPGDAPRLFVLDNIDPNVVATLLEKLDLSKTFLVYVSKSGGTPEPAADFMVFYDAFTRQGGTAESVAMICDKKENGINQIAAELGCHLMHIPDILGGRYSVLSPVGLLPAEMIGVDGNELLAGAKECHESILNLPLDKNPIYQLGRAFQAYAENGKAIHFLFTYSNLLAELNLWFLQLWSESLGKHDDLQGNKVRAGELPTVGIGATDQHSVLQLLKEGPIDKIVGFMRVANSDKDVTIPEGFKDYVEYNYFPGHTIGQLLDVERISTEIALNSSGTPCYTVSIEKLDAKGLGALFYFWEAIVVYMAELKNVNPFDQPGVQSGKDMTYALMGRTDYADKREAQQQALDAYKSDSVELGL